MLKQFLKHYFKRNIFYFSNTKYFRLFSTLSSEVKVHDDLKFLTACCVSDEINVRLVKTGFRNIDNVKEIILPVDAKKLAFAGQYKSERDEKRFFIFNVGVISFWNMNNTERLEIIEIIKPFQTNPIRDYFTEEDDLKYCFHNDKTKINKEIIYLKKPQSLEQCDKLIEQQMTLSEALSQSVKLGIYESQFEEFSMSINGWIDQLKSGKKWSIKETEVLKKTGELFKMRYKINVSSHLTEVPDFYWEKPDLEILFNQIRSDLSIYQRTRALNEKLNLYCELTEILRNHIAANHSTRLEIMIIVLILIEVLFECFAFYEKYTIRQIQEEHSQQQKPQHWQLDKDYEG